MTHALADTWFMTQRHFRNLFRQPAWIFISLVQPVVWLLLYGALFRRIVEIPGFGAGSYIDFLTPGHRRHDLPLLRGLERHGPHRRHRPRRDRPLPRQPGEPGLADRRAARPGRLVGVIQSAIIVVLGLIVGADYPGGIAGIVALTVCAVLLGTGIGALQQRRRPALAHAKRP